MATGILLNIMSRERVSSYFRKKNKYCSNYVCVFMSPNTYTGTGTSYRDVKRAVDSLFERKLIKIVKGHNYQSIGGRNITTRLYLSENFYSKLVDGMKIYDDESFLFEFSKIIKLYYSMKKTTGISNRELKYRSLELSYNYSYCKDKSKDVFGKNIRLFRGKPKKNPFPYIGRSTSELEKILWEINSSFKNYTEFQYHRVFGKTINEYGRFYNQIQYLPSELRKAIFTKGGYVELDFKTFNISSLYYLHTGHNYLGSDIYMDILKAIPSLKGINDEKLENYRKIIKPIVNTIFGVSSRLEAINSIHQTLLRKRICSEEEILTAFETVAYEIKEFFYTMKIEWCQNIESKIIEKLMLEMVKDGLLPFSVHDCIYVKFPVQNKYDILKESIFQNEISYYINS